MIEVDNLLDIAQRTLNQNKALDLTIINLAGKTNFADYMIIASGTSRRHITFMANDLKKNIKTTGFKEVTIEGLKHADWVLVDSRYIIIHIFRPEFREFYNLESLWGNVNSQPNNVK